MCFFSPGENTGDGELDLSGIDDNEIDRVRCLAVPGISFPGCLDNWGRQNGP